MARRTSSFNQVDHLRHWHLLHNTERGIRHGHEMDLHDWAVAHHECNDHETGLQIGLLYCSISADNDAEFNPSLHSTWGE